MMGEEITIAVRESANGEPESPSQEKDGRDAQDDKEIPPERMKKAELIEKINELEESVLKNHDLYLRSQAEIENMRKRFQKEKTDLVKFSNESLIKQLLSVLDNLEKAVHYSKNEGSLEGLAEGVTLTLKGLVDTLDKAGLKEVKAVGELFDPNFHEAITEQVDDNVKPGTVIQEFQKGYLLNERLIRPSMVMISKSSS